jgi:lipopolysaccharide exporter
MAFLISTTATAELAAILNNMLLPMFSKLQNDREKLSKAFSFSFGTISIVTFLMAALVCACSPDLYRLALGNKWTPALPLVPWLTAWGVCSVFAGSLAGVMQALCRPKLFTQTVFLMVGLMALGIYPMMQWLGSMGVAMLLAGIGIVMQLIRYWIVARLLRRTYWQVLGHVLIPMVACVVAVTLVRYVVGTTNQATGWVSLLISAVGTTAVYGLIIAAAGSRLQPSLNELFGRAKPMFAMIGKPSIADGSGR